MTTSDEIWDDDAEEITIEVSDELGAFVSIHFDSRELDALQEAVEPAGTSATAFIKAAALDQSREPTPSASAGRPGFAFVGFSRVAGRIRIDAVSVGSVRHRVRWRNWTPFTAGTRQLC